MKSYQSDFHETWNEALAEEKRVDCWCRSRLCCKNIKTLMQFWQQIGKGLDFLSGFQGCFSGTFQTQKNDGTR